MPIPEIYKELVNELIAATRQDRVDWRERDENTAWVAIPGNQKVEIWGGYDDEAGRTFVSFGIRDQSTNQFVDTFYCENEEPGYASLDTLHGEALRKARKVDERLRDLRKLLKEGKRIGDSD